MAFILKEVWLWITIAACIAILLGCMLLVWLIIQLPEWLRSTVLIFLLVCGGVVGGYKDYLKARAKERP